MVSGQRPARSGEAVHAGGLGVEGKCLAETGLGEKNGQKRDGVYYRGLLIFLRSSLRVLLRRY